MSAARPLPELGSIFFDARGNDRALRVSWHSESDLVVLSLWRDNVCAASFRLAVDEVPELIEMLRSGPVDSSAVRQGKRRSAAQTNRGARRQIYGIR